VLFVIEDDWGFGHAGAYGCQWIRTPNFDRVAREGVLFTHAFTSNPKCSPCRATILTGRNTWQLKEAVNHYSIFPNEFEVYPDLLEKSGYFIKTEPTVRIRYSEYCTLSAQKRSLNWNNVRPQMSEVHKPHFQAGYLRSARFEKRLDPEGNPDWMIC